MLASALIALPLELFWARVREGSREKVFRFALIDFLFAWL